ncbi:MAG TPA: spermidine/putrescine ABC transporter substrate-binding protein [Actinomycetes bacterium]|nr:spermidine/putrescine ABC transporter substrate-binding protein [Actinomycetes bacterium]
MTDSKEPINILAPPAAIDRISRRLFMAGGLAAGVGGAALLAGCGNDEPQTPAAGASSSSGPIEDNLEMFTWGEYNSPKVIKQFETENDLKFNLSSYNSNEQLIAKLTAAQGTSGYDIIVPTGPFIPALVQHDLVQTLDLARIPNFKNLDPQYTNQPWDPNNEHSVCKDWGTTGYCYDTTQISTEMSTWQDFLDVAMGEASGQVSILDSPDNICGLYLWANDINWMTEDQAQLDACREFSVNQLAPHVKSFESYPGSNGIPQGTFWLAHAWNGDARLGIMSADPGQWKWVFPGPRSEIWMDNYAIPTGAKNINAAYAWINYLLDPEVSLQELEFIGYNTGVKGIEPAARAAGVEMLDLIFFDEAQVSTMEAGELNSAQTTRVQISNEMKAAAGG